MVGPNKISLTVILNSISNVLNTVNKIIPVYNEVKPIIKNLSDLKGKFKDFNVNKFINKTNTIQNKKEEETTSNISYSSPQFFL